MDGVKELQIEHLSGVPGRLAIELVNEGQAAPVSQLFFGDNGSGKSSIVDALEFALQARVRRVGGSLQVYEALRSRAVEESPRAVAVMADGEELSRGFDLEPEPLEVKPPEPHSEFTLAPIVLRREDVTRFWETPEGQRQVLFRGFFTPPGKGIWMRLGLEEEQALRVRREELKQERREALEILAGALKMISRDIPLESVGVYDSFISKSFAQGFGRDWPTGGPSAERPEEEAIFRAAITVRRLTEAILRLQRELQNAAAAQLGQTAIAEVLKVAGEELSLAFAEISDASFVKQIWLSPGGTGNLSLRIRLQLENGQVVAPEAVLSEGNLDLLALLLFTSIARAAAEQGQGRILVLDDVVQSVDAAIRSHFFEYLIDRFDDWQFVITTHDRLWREHVRDLFAAANKPLRTRNISLWSFSGGPVLGGDSRRKRDQVEGDIRAGGDGIRICGDSGVLLEELCQQLSWRLPVSVTRNKNDIYLLGTLWPTVSARLTEIGAEGLVKDVDRFAKLRNLSGAHYVEAGQQVSDAEARQYAGAVVALWDAVNCSSCHGWIRSQKGGSWACGCGRTELMT